MTRSPGSIGRLALALALVLGPGAASGCSEDQTALLVEVTSPDLAIPADVDALRFDAETEGGKVADQTFPVSATWPHSLAILPSGGDTSARVTLRVIGLKGGTEVIRRVRQTAFVPGQTRPVDVVFTRACYEITCPGDADCVEGSCVGAMADGGVDGGPMDAGPMDAGPGDAGPPDGGVDANVDDSGPEDAGCTPTGAEVCNLMDDDCNGMVDDGLPCPGSIVISEVATGGPAGGSDEFVELYNRTEADIDPTGMELEYRSSSGSGFAHRATVPAGLTLPAHGYLLLAGTGYGRSTTPDVPSAWAISQGFAASGGHIRVTDDLGAELDRLGWGTAIEPEGAAQPALAMDQVQSYERKAVMGSTAASMAAGGADADRGNGWDTNDNSEDFVHRSTPQPQNTASAPEAP